MSFTINTPHHGALIGDQMLSGRGSSLLNNIAVPASFTQSFAQSGGMINAGIGGLLPNTGGNPMNGNRIVSGYDGVLSPGSQIQFADPALHLAANQTAVPPSTTITVTSAVGAGAGLTEVFLLNQQFLNNIDDNGSGAGSITYAYQDSFGGRNLSNILSDARLAVGMVCFGGYIRMNVTAGGAGDPDGLADTNPAFLNFNAFGRSTPTDINIDDNDTRADQDTSIQVFTCVANMSRNTQFSFFMPVGDTAKVKLYFRPNFKV